MLNKIVFVFIFAFGLANVSAQENKLNFPAPIGFVSDFADVLIKEQELSLERRLVEFAQKSNLEIRIVTVETTGDKSIDDYSLAMAREWNIGSKTKSDYAALLLIDVGNRKYRTQINRDLETVFSDSHVGEMQKQTLVPSFRKNDFFKGISDYLLIFYENFAKARGSKANFNSKTLQSLVNESVQSVAATPKKWKLPKFK